MQTSMTCPSCAGKGFVLAPHVQPKPLAESMPWNGAERRAQGRAISNEDLKFREVVPAAVYQCCQRCDGAGVFFNGFLQVA